MSSNTGHAALNNPLLTAICVIFWTETKLLLAPDAPLCIRRFCPGRSISVRVTLLIPQEIAVVVMGPPS